MHPRNPLHFGEILVCLDGSSYSQAAVEYATQIALEHKASLTGIGVIDLRGLQRSSGPAPIGAMHYDRLADQQQFQETRETVAGVLKDFGQTCQERGNPSLDSFRDGQPISGNYRRIKVSRFYYNWAEDLF